ncbi:MAG: discoidin domain-containing protein, partial [Candidatus Zipacnadales bacterium]
VLRGQTNWYGVISVESRTEPEGAWTPAGWAKTVVPAKQDETRFKHVIAVPVPTVQASGLRVHVRPDRPGTLLIDEVSVNAGGGVSPENAGNLAADCPYRVRPEPARRYPDRGGMLTDGQISERGWGQGRSVGWLGHDVAIHLDLGQVRPIDRVVLYCDGGGSGSVQFPTYVTLEFGQDRLPVRPGTVGQGPPPEPSTNVVLVDGSTVQLMGEQPVGTLKSAWGCFDIRPLETTQARFLTLRCMTAGWIMLSEVEVWSQGINVAPLGTYTVSPAPTPTEEERYGDDGLRLTDGYIVQSWEAKRISGWSEAQEIEVTLDLGRQLMIREVTVHALGGGQYGVLAPPAAEIEASVEGVTFTAIGSGVAQDPGGGTCVHVSLPVRLDMPQEARLVRVRLTPSPQWTMLSEITVR